MTLVISMLMLVAAHSCAAFAAGVPAAPIQNPLVTVSWTDEEKIMIALVNPDFGLRRITIKLGRIHMGKEVVAYAKTVDLPAKSLVTVAVKRRWSNNDVRNHGELDRVFLYEGKTLAGGAVIQGVSARRHYQVEAYVVTQNADIRWAVNPTLFAGPEAQSIGFGVKRTWQLENHSEVTGPVQVIQAPSTVEGGAFQSVPSLQDYLVFQQTPLLHIKARAPEVENAAVVSFEVACTWQDKNGIQSGTVAGPSVLVYNPQSLRRVETEV